MSTTHFHQLKISKTLHYALTASVAMHLCAFSMIFFWNPEMQTIAHKTPIVKIQVALLETPQKLPAPSIAKSPAETQASKANATKNFSKLRRPANPQSFPLQAPHSSLKRTRNFLTKPSFDMKGISETVATASSQLISSDIFSKSVTRESSLKSVMTAHANTRPVSLSSQPRESLKNSQRTALRPVNPVTTKTLARASDSSLKTYAVLEFRKHLSKNLKPVSIEKSPSITAPGSGPVSSARFFPKANYHSPVPTPVEMTSLSDVSSKPESAQGGKGNDDELRKGYTRQIRHRIAQEKFYPAVARRRGLEGQPVVAFILKKDGSLDDLALDQTSGHKILDQAALKAVKKGAPFPEIPEKLNLEKFKFKLPVSFDLE